MSFDALGPALTGMLSAVRSARPIISYRGQDFTAEVYPSLTELSYREGIQYFADNISIRLADPEGKFRFAFSWRAAQPLDLAFEALNWDFPGQRLHRNAGRFWIHSVRFTQSKPAGTTINIEAGSSPANQPARLEKKSRAWTKSTLKAIAGQIASDNGLTLHYVATENPKIGRLDQRDESDLVVLNRQCECNDLILKIKDGGLWIHSHEELEKQAPIGTILAPTPTDVGGVNGRGGIINWEFEERIEDCYRAAEIAFRDNKSGKVVRASVSDPDNQDLGPTLRDKNYFYQDDDSDSDGAE